MCLHYVAEGTRLARPRITHPRIPSRKWSTAVHIQILFFFLPTKVSHFWNRFWIIGIRQQFSHLFDPIHNGCSWDCCHSLNASKSHAIYIHFQTATLNIIAIALCFIAVVELTTTVYTYIVLFLTTMTIFIDVVTFTFWTFYRFFSFIEFLSISPSHLFIWQRPILRTAGDINFYD